MTWRRSSSAWWALARTTPAARTISSGGASGRTSSAPACRLSSDRRCASTSCISRAMRVRSCARAWATRRSRSASAWRVRSRSASMSSRWERMNMPQPTTAAWMPVASTTLTQNGMSSGYSEKYTGSRAIASATIGDRDDRPAVHGDAEQPDQRGAARGRRDAAEQDGQQRDADRPAAPQPDRQAGDHAGGDDQDGDGGRRVRAVLEQGAGAVDAAADGDEEAGRVDDPVATAARRGPLGALVALGLRRREQPLQPRGAARGGQAARGNGAHVSVSGYADRGAADSDLRSFSP